MQFYGISFMHPYKSTKHPAIDQAAYMDAWKKYHKTAGKNVDVLMSVHLIIILIINQFNVQILVL